MRNQITILVCGDPKSEIKEFLKDIGSIEVPDNQISSVLEKFVLESPYTLESYTFQINILYLTDITRNNKDVDYFSLI